MTSKNMTLVLSVLMMYVLYSVEAHTNFRRRRDTGSQECEDPTVNVQQGTLKGKCYFSVEEQEIHLFMGIPYAKPPTGPLRFKDPESPEDYDGVYDATKHRSVCPQYNISWTNIYTTDYIGDEDCLYLNVYTPCVESSESLPVMVWFHEGSFKWDSGNRDVYGPDYLVKEEVILVTFNFRLGPLGFLYMEEAAPGNAGLKDQVQALRWIHDNIGSFGGDVDRITIFGVGSGGASIQLHLHSKMSEGLFSKAILQSGWAINKWTTLDEPNVPSSLLAKAVGCDKNDKNEAVDCMRKVDVKTLIEKATTDSLPDTEKNEILLTRSVFRPSVEYPVEGVQPFLPEPIFDLVTKQGGPSYPLLAGVTNMESMYFFLKYDFFDADVQKKLDKSWKDIIIPELIMPIEEDKTDEALESIRDFYMNGMPLTNDTLVPFLNLLTYILFGGLDYSLLCRVNHPNPITYVYEFTVDDKLNFVKPKLPEQLPGACHGDLVGYLFAVEDLQVPKDSYAAKIRDRVVAAWTEFAKSGEIDGWTPFNKQGLLTNVIGEMQSVELVRQKEDEFWFDFYHEFAPDVQKC